MTLFSAPNYCGEFDNAGAMMSVDETLLCSFQVSPIVPFSLRARCDLLPIDPEASGEKGQVSLWRDECGASSDATAQAEEEGQQDGLDHDGLQHCTTTPLFSTTGSFLIIISFFLSHSPTVLIFFVSDRKSVV